MKLEKGEISSSELIFTVAGFIHGSILLVAFVIGISKQDTWVVVLSGLAISSLLVLLYIALAYKFPGNNLVQINDIIYGPYLGKLISALYIWFFLSLVFLNLRFMADFILIYIMPETPITAILIMFTFVCAWAVKKGIEVIVRCSYMFVVITIIIILSLLVLQLKDMKATNFLPLFELTFKDFVQGTHIMIAIPFAEVMIFLMIIPYLNKVKQAKKSILSGLIIGGATLLVVVVKTTAVLGAAVVIMVSPPFEAVRLINIADILTRMEILAAIVLLITMFLKISILYYATILGTAQIFKLRSYKPLVLPIVIISICLTIISFDSHTEHAYWGSSFAPTYSLAFELLLPLLSLLIAKIRSLPKRRGGKCS